MRKAKCQFCAGSGVEKSLGNQDAHYDGWEDPLPRDEPCEECGGTGQDLTVTEPVKHTRSLRYTGE